MPRQQRGLSVEFPDNAFFRRSWPPDPPIKSPASVVALAGAKVQDSSTLPNDNNSLIPWPLASTPKLFLARREHYSRGEFTPEMSAYILEHGLDHATITAYAGLFAVHLCKFFGHNSEPIFDFDRDGVPSAVIEVLSPDRHAKVIDLIAWPLDNPDCFATAVRECDMLGAINMINRNGRPLRVRRTPLDWIKAGCTGCVPLNPVWAGTWLHKAGGPFIADDLEHGREIRTLLGKLAGEHEIIIKNTQKKQVAA